MHVLHLAWFTAIFRNAAFLNPSVLIHSPWRDAVLSSQAPSDAVSLTVPSSVA